MHSTFFILFLINKEQSRIEPKSVCIINAWGCAEILPSCHCLHGKKGDSGGGKGGEWWVVDPRGKEKGLWYHPSDLNTLCWVRLGENVK